MSDDPLLFERVGAVAKLTLNRPEAGNALNLALSRALMHASIACDEDETIRCVTLTGAGRMFCAGGDIDEFAERGELVPALMKETTAYLHMAVSRFARMGKPLVTAVNGAAAGAGLGLAMLGDISIAGASAKFVVAYSGIGLSPDLGTSWLLPRLVGLRKAQEMALTNTRVTAEEAASIGLITRVVADQALESEVASIAAGLTQSATAALGRTRNLLLGSFSTSLEEHLEREARSITECARGPERREGIAAFRGKRKADFTNCPSAAAD